MWWYSSYVTDRDLKHKNQFVHYFLILFIFSIRKLISIARLNCQSPRNKVKIDPTVFIRAFTFLSDISKYSFFSPSAVRYPFSKVQQIESRQTLHRQKHSSSSKITWFNTRRQTLDSGAWVTKGVIKLE